MSRLSCPGCSAKIHVPARMTRGWCPSCGAGFEVRQSAGVRGRNPAANPDAEESSGAASDAKSEYQGFHGKNPTVKRIDIPPLPPVAWRIGTLKSLSYMPPEGSARAKDKSGRPIEYTHEFRDHGLGIKFGKEPDLYSSPDGKQLIIAGGSFRVDKGLGIVG